MFGFLSGTCAAIGSTPNISAVAIVPNPREPIRKPCGTIARSSVPQSSVRLLEREDAFPVYLHVHPRDCPKKILASATQRDYAGDGHSPSFLQSQFFDHTGCLWHTHPNANLELCACRRQQGCQCGDRRLRYFADFSASSILCRTVEGLVVPLVATVPLQSFCDIVTCWKPGNGHINPFALTAGALVGACFPSLQGWCRHNDPHSL